MSEYYLTAWQNRIFPNQSSLSPLSVDTVHFLPTVQISQIKFRACMMQHAYKEHQHKTSFVRLAAVKTTDGPCLTLEHELGIAGKWVTRDSKHINSVTFSPSLHKNVVITFLFLSCYFNAQLWFLRCLSLPYAMDSRSVRTMLQRIQLGQHCFQITAWNAEIRRGG